MSIKYTRGLGNVALGIDKADIVIKNGFVVNVFTNEVIKADVAISNGVIVGVGDYEGINEIDAKGKTICPGFIDAHLHLESTLVRPQELIHRAARKGTTTFVVDPHEAANVSGVKGITYILEQTKNVQANVFVMIPSCVPAMDIEDNGATIFSEDMKSFLDNPRILGLGEVMDWKSVLNGNELMLEKLETFKSKVIDGHAGYLNDKEIMCYKLAGVDTDHECCDFETAMQELRVGMKVLIREGTGAKNLEAIVKGIVENNIPIENFAFCTDDKHIEEIEKDGHIGFNIKKAIELGIKPVDAVKMATINSARAYGLKNIGAIAPGYQADIVIVSDLERLEIEQVFFKGKEILLKTPLNNIPIDRSLLHTVNIGNINLQSFELKMNGDEIPIINLIKGQLLTTKTFESVPVEDGIFISNNIYNKVVVFERHKATGKIGIGVVKGYNINNGAIASTFCHDSHNLIVIGDNDNDMLMAVRELEKCGGGYTVIENNKIIDTLELSVMGLISNQDNEFVSKKLATMIKKLHEMGVPDGIDPFIMLSFLALPVIPEIRITARGIFDVLEDKFLM